MSVHQWRKMYQIQLHSASTSIMDRGLQHEDSLPMPHSMALYIEHPANPNYI